MQNLSKTDSEFDVIVVEKMILVFVDLIILYIRNKSEELKMSTQTNICSFNVEQTPIYLITL